MNTNRIQGKKRATSKNKEFSSFQKEVEELKQLSALSRNLTATKKEGTNIKLSNYYSL